MGAGRGAGGGAGLGRAGRQLRRSASGNGGARGHPGCGDRPDVRARPPGRVRPGRHLPRRSRSSARNRPGRLPAALAFLHARALRGHRRDAGSRRGGVRLRQQPARLRPGGGPGERLRLSGLRARLHPRPVLRGQGPLPLGSAIGRSRRHLPHRRPGAGDVSPRRAPVPLDPAGPRPGRVSGPPGAHLLAGAGRAGALRVRHQRPGGKRGGESARGHRPRPPGHRERRFPQPRNRGHARRQRRHRRLADPERAAQHRVGGELGVVPPRRRGRHRLLASRRPGGGRRRHPRDAHAHRAGAHERPGHRGRAPRRRRLPHRPSDREARGNPHPDAGVAAVPRNHSSARASPAHFIHDRRRAVGARGRSDRRATSRGRGLDRAGTQLPRGPQRGGSHRSPRPHGGLR